MKTFFRILFCILACLSTVAAFFLGAYFGFVPCLIAVIAAVGFAALMYLCARKKPEKKPDFMDPPAPPFETDGKPPKQ